MLKEVKKPIFNVFIGSTAIKHYFPDFPREPKDIDIVTNSKEGDREWNGKKVERLENPIILERNILSSSMYIDKDDLCTLKASHLCWNINWEKHMWDLQFLLKKGCIIDNNLFMKLYDYWNVYHSKNKRSDLKMSKEDFFNNNVNYDEMEHDDLHKIINPVPIYTKVLKDNCEVELDENKFYNLSHEDKINFVREEVMVMAYERYKHLNYKIAYSKMLKKFIISHAPIWSLKFIFENFIELHIADRNYVKIIKDGLQ